MEVVVNDTNIFIDLYSVGLLKEAFDLPLSFHTVDFVIDELIDAQKNAVLKYRTVGKLTVHVFSAKELMDVLSLKASAGGNVSVTDCASWHYAKVNNYVLLTGDGQLRKKAILSNVQVHGVLYLLRLMVDENIVSPSEMSEKLKQLMQINRRLPRKDILNMIAMMDSNRSVF